MVDPFRANHNITGALEAIIRLPEVKRWHMVETTRSQSVMEHSGTVALLAGYVAHTAPELYFGPSKLVAWYGLVHDIAEAFVGDIPSHTKRECDGLVNKLEEKYTSPWMRMNDASVQVIDLIKAVDLLEAIVYIRRHGNSRAASNAGSSLREALDKHMQKVVKYWPPEVTAHVMTVFTEFESA